MCVFEKIKMLFSPSYNWGDLKGDIYNDHLQ